MKYRIADVSNYDRQIKYDEANALLDKLNRKMWIINNAIGIQDYDELEDTCKALRQAIEVLKI